MRLLLSYGHDHDASLMERIRADLEAVGHETWIDRERIKTGDNWRRTYLDKIRAKTSRGLRFRPENRSFTSLIKACARFAASICRTIRETPRCPRWVELLSPLEPSPFDAPSARHTMNMTMAKAMEASTGWRANRV